MKAVVTDPILLALVESMAIKVNVKQDESSKEKQKARNAQIMRTAESGGFTCKAQGCFNKAEFFGTDTYFCESHMLVQVGA